MRNEEKNKKNKKAFSLIEMIVAIFILILVMVGMVAIIVSVFQAYQKSQAVKTISENANFALSSMAKEIRMGKVEKSIYSDGATGSNYLLITRNRDQSKVCYAIAQDYIGMTIVDAGATECPDIADGAYDNEKIMDLSPMGESVFVDTTKSKFRSCPSNEDPSNILNLNNCGANGTAWRGWVFITLKIDMVSGKEAESDNILLQTTVSSRDYGWAE